MDWSRAKTILIISFTLLNALLGYQVWTTWNEQSKASEVSVQTVEELNQLLAAEKITLSDTLLTELPEIGYLRITVTQRGNEWQTLRPRVDAVPDEAENVTEALEAQVEHLSEYELDEGAVQKREVDLLSTCRRLSRIRGTGRIEAGGELFDGVPPS